jgi:hypothetical protein
VGDSSGNGTRRDFKVSVPHDRGAPAVEDATAMTIRAIARDVSNMSGDLTNATAIGPAARVDASDKIRLGNGAVTVIG